MYSKKAVWAVIALLVAESVAIAAFPARTPRPIRLMTGAINLVAAAALWTLLRQREKR